MAKDEKGWSLLTRSVIHREWWKKCNFMLTAALDSGLAVSEVIGYFALQNIKPRSSTLCSTMVTDKSHPGSAKLSKCSGDSIPGNRAPLVFNENVDNLLALLQPLDDRESSLADNLAGIISQVLECMLTHSRPANSSTVARLDSRTMAMLDQLRVLNIGQNPRRSADLSRRVDCEYIRSLFEIFRPWMLRNAQMPQSPARASFLASPTSIPTRYTCNEACFFVSAFGLFVNHIVSFMLPRHRPYRTDYFSRVIDSQYMLGSNEEIPIGALMHVSPRVDAVVDYAVAVKSGGALMAASKRGTPVLAVYKKLNAWARMLCRSQCGRTHCWGLAVAESSVRGCLMYPEAIASTQKMDVLTTCGRGELIKFFVYWSLCNDAQRGFGSMV
ncbi:hypothetical protein GQ54DRAFT_307896 [Martensiomyces pterosporus]|nr:hypothetical protein GQ54DRAFT_307896 [Martensiomyces pterosporus]